MSKDYYKTLGVEKNASQDEIKKAYKNLAKKYHPDINKESGATDKFKEINEAAAVLGDQQKRQQYDQFGTADFGQGQGQSHGFEGFDFRNFTGGGGDFDDLFDNVFEGFGFSGFGRQRSRASKGRDIAAEVQVSLEEVLTGTTRTISMRKLSVCKKCEGKGGEGMAACETCKGTGAVKHARRTPFGTFATTTSCNNCGGNGESFENVCNECSGEGRTLQTNKIDVKIPPGVEEEMQLRVSGEGESGERGGRAGDLFVVVHVKSHNNFERDENDIRIKLTMPFAIACLGGEIEIPTLQGTAKLRVPQGTQSGTVLRMKGKGLPNVHHQESFGDELVEVSIKVPEKISKKQVELLKEFEGLDKDKKKGWFG